MRRSYRGLIIWTVILMGVMAGVIFLPTEDNGLKTRLILNGTVWMIVGLFVWIMYTGQVYWINGVSYEEAVEAGPHRRRYFVQRHLVRFAAAAVVFLLFSVFAQFRHLNIMADTIVFCAVTTVAAVSTIRIRL